jgi:ABC-type transport system involved in cytochrome c biogenesis permease component
MAFNDDWRRVRAIAWKDLTTERRSKAGFNGVVALGVTILMLFGFALGPDTQAIRDAASGALWLAALFAAVLAFNRSYQVELESGALDSLLLFPMLVPALLAAMQASKALLGGDLMDEAGAWIKLLVAYDVIFLIATHLAFEHVIEA